MGILVEKARKTIVWLNKVFVTSILFIELVLLLIIIATAFQFGFGKINIFSFIALAIILLWLGILIGYYAWAIYFYNINLGQTNESWAQLKEMRSSNSELADCDNNSGSNEAGTADNHYRDQSLGLPPGTIRGTLALTLMVGGLALFIYSMGDPQIQETNSFIYDNFEFFKTAFLMMIAFYFGAKSLETLRKNTVGGIILKPGNAPVTPVASPDNSGADVETQPSDLTAPPTATESQAATTDPAPPANTTALLDSTQPKVVTTGNTIAHKAIDDDDIKEQCDKIGIEPAAMKAVIQTESGGSGFLPNGLPKILFEGHIFWKHLAEKKAAGQIPEGPEFYAATNPDIVYQKWTKQFYLSGEKEYSRLEKAVKIDRDSAYMATSWGKFQILGENFKLAGFNTVNDFVEAEKISEVEHLKAFINFITRTKYKGLNLISYLQKKDWASFARAYNGPGYAQNKYDLKLEQAYDSFANKMNTQMVTTLTRTTSQEMQTLGDLAVSENGQSLFTCKTLELPWKNNQRNVSCIPTGTYQVVKRTSEKYGNHFHLLNVPDRSMILIHSGNYYTQTQGCILVGSGYADINNDKVTDIKESKVTLQKLYSLMPDQFEIKIS